MFDNLTGLGIGLITFAIVIGVGSIMLYNFGGTIGCTNADWPTWNSTTNECSNGTTSFDIAPNGQSYTNTNYLLTQLGTSGLAGWTPAIIAFSVGMLFLGAFLIGKGKNRKY